MARYDVIEKDHRQYYGYDEPGVSTHPLARHDQVDDAPMMVTSLQSLSLVEASHQKRSGPTFEMYDRVLRRGTFS
ncbi:Relaxase/mobilization nuclease MobA [Pseudomonas coronafaciens pv. garcae]|uniref:Relaxase/mobilization nuclease MobA n=1 Tax=Pseudomonas coronafaciens pv. garcae TaxID=251653 RepID=A0AB37QQX5_9PSED|nr:Relaxase/mobilization nuclease MobA [Pseudomonas syringae pv. tomato]RMS01961.1 Relaxase/mobilization nuclease MobA [Pseudomonas coronafaciens pv. garcae]RMS03641.1 Relaxase/mobilization nuclease MobA [Pseudomonas coronafaciens pv. garcae]RMS12065.1 Relaxase/mobilization nuclease MobA [Pseudomonas coronafaciens pv. coronafaciens]RMV57971.1 Relaxase/mobilization nuclease MobA [Pseudomonas amygdali pv. lachrymans]